MASQVDRGSILTQGWQNVFDLVKSNSSVADPLKGSADYRKWIFSREPDVKKLGFQSFPYIIVHPATVRFSDAQGRQRLDRKRRIVSWMVEVEVVTCDRGYGDGDGKGNAQANQVLDDILELFNGVTARNTLQANGMLFSTPQVTSEVVEPFMDTLVYRRSVFLNFDSYMAVSA